MNNIDNPRPGMARFHGPATAVFYVALCHDCDMALPHPSEKARNDWIREHATTGHKISVAIDVRPDALEVVVKRQELVTRLREKYSHVAVLAAGICGNYSRCHRYIQVGDRMIQWAGRYFHAECLDDASYLRMATIQDIAPDAFKDAPPVKIHLWHRGVNIEPTHGLTPPWREMHTRQDEYHAPEIFAPKPGTLDVKVVPREPQPEKRRRQSRHRRRMKGE